ncbi:uncharacterized protein N7443_005008 [Penicillium atrosanguineum]|nr:uncharacterized protein N7443_005008 [Penicillium atrosanguineum]KAJ5305348.1 hypothetical protein N7443_005008 [Penicillium atrosanguineum]
MAIELSSITNRRGRRSEADYLDENWVFDIACCIGTTAALTAITEFLLAYDNKTIPEWPNGITLNAVLSFLSLILNACLLGAVASCLGQVKWNSFNRTRRPLANINTYDSASWSVLGCIPQNATIGALTTNLAAGNAPFIQQMAMVEKSLILSNFPASIAHAHRAVQQTAPKHRILQFHRHAQLGNALPPFNDLQSAHEVLISLIYYHIQKRHLGIQAIL